MIAERRSAARERLEGDWIANGGAQGLRGGCELHEVGWRKSEQASKAGKWEFVYGRESTGNEKIAIGLDGKSSWCPIKYRTKR